MNPGCYGSAVRVSASSPSCRACPQMAGCVYEASLMLDKLPNTPAHRAHRQALQVVGMVLRDARAGQGATPQREVKESTRGIVRMTLTSAECAQVANLPDRVARQVRTLMERGWFNFARRELVAGRNPAAKGWKKVLCASLLAGKATRADLQLAFAEQLDLSPASAKVQVSNGVAVFSAGQLVRVHNSIITISQN